eukprot:Awhi_evm1s11916
MAIVVGGTPTTSTDTDSSTSTPICFNSNNNNKESSDNNKSITPSSSANSLDSKSSVGKRMSHPVKATKKSPLSHRRNGSFLFSKKKPSSPSSLSPNSPNPGLKHCNSKSSDAVNVPRDLYELTDDHSNLNTNTITTNNNNISDSTLNCNFN